MKYMMATKATHKVGDLSRDEPDLCVIYNEDAENYIGNWQTGYGFVEVKFPKATTFELTEDQKNFYRSKVLEHSNGIRFPAYRD